MQLTETLNVNTKKRKKRCGEEGRRILKKPCHLTRKRKSASISALPYNRQDKEVQYRKPDHTVRVDLPKDKVFGPGKDKNSIPVSS